MENQVISNDIELQIVDWILDCVQTGFFVTFEQVIETVLNFLDDNGKTQFTGRNQRVWYESFLSRHPNVCREMANNVKRLTTKITVTTLIEWSLKIENFLKKFNQIDLLQDPSRVFILEELAFFLVPKEESVMRKMNVFKYIGHLEWITVTFGINAKGTQIPYMVVLPQNKNFKNIINVLSLDTRLALTQTSWLTPVSLLAYIKKVFIPWLYENNITVPVILFLNGYSNLLSLELSNYCKEYGIILLSLYQNCKEKPHPLDVEIIPFLQKEFSRELEGYDLNARTKFVEKHFTKIVTNLFKNPQIELAAQRSFCSCGIYPFVTNFVKTPGNTLNTEIAQPHTFINNIVEITDENNSNKRNLKIINIVNNEQIQNNSALIVSTPPPPPPLKQSTTTSNKKRKLETPKTEDIFTTLELLEKFIGTKRLKRFADCYKKQQYYGSRTDLSLYNFWKSLQDVLNTEEKTIDLTAEEESVTKEEIVIETNIENSVEETDEEVNEMLQLKEQPKTNIISLDSNDIEDSLEYFEIKAYSGSDVKQEIELDLEDILEGPSTSKKITYI